MKLISLPAAVLAAALTLAGTASAAGPLPAPPPPGGPSASTIFDAMLAIARAATTNPAAAQAATFSYNAAIQQYNIHDYARARMSALTAISQAGAPVSPASPVLPVIGAPPRAFPTFYPTPSVSGADEADAENYVALARRSLTQCGTPGQTPAALQQQYQTAVNALVAKKYAAAEGASRSIVEQCAAAAQALAASSAGVPLPTSTPLPLNYSPIPVATLIPDPALLQTPKALPTATPAPTRRR